MSGPCGRILQGFFTREIVLTVFLENCQNLEGTESYYGVESWRENLRYNFSPPKVLT